MAELAGNLWEWNLARIVVVDVSDDYRLMAEPMPAFFYPVLQEIWLPRHRLDNYLKTGELINGYLYDWHERSVEEQDKWYVAVVDRDLARQLGAE
jgi:hypothetical protein